MLSFGNFFIFTVVLKRPLTAATSCFGHIRKGSRYDYITFTIATFDLCMWKCMCEILHLKHATIVLAAAETFKRDT